MKMPKKLLSTVLGLYLCFQSGCSIQPVRLVVVNGTNLQGKPNIPLVKQKQPQYSIKVSETSPSYQADHTDQDANAVSSYRLKYHPSTRLNHWVAVEGRLPNGNTYPVVLDTGASVALFVNDIHILENKLPITPSKKGISDPVGWGTCQLPELSLGQIAFADWPCFYREQHAEIQFFGLPVRTSKEIIAGVPLLREFKYVAFDGISKEVAFSLTKTFEPLPTNIWTNYPFVIEEDFSGNAFLLVQIPVAAELIEVQLDTGSGNGLAMGEEVWNRIRHGIADVKLKKGKDLYPYEGSFACMQTFAPKLQVGNRTIDNAKISILPDDCPLFDRCSALLGMQYFEDTVIVLDFEHRLMWLMNPQDRPLVASDLPHRTYF
jgi:hypothetical protein